MLASTKPLVMVGPPTRASFLALAATRLAEGESIVRAVDTFRESGAVTVQSPVDPSAVVVAREVPRLQPGGITEIVTYLLVRDPTVREVTFRGEETIRDVEIALRPLAVPGRVLERAPLHSSA